MKVMSGPLRADARPKKDRVIAAIGVFDALHRGHQRVIGRAVRLARRRGLKSAVVTFHPHPVSVLRPSEFSAYVLTLPHRLKIMERLGVDYCWVLPFDRKMSRMPASDFVRDLLAGMIGVAGVVVGEDFEFGHDRQGSTGFLRDSGKTFGFSVDVVPTLKKNNIKIKTRFIKKLIASGNLAAIRSFLGRSYAVTGRVIHGEGRGKRLGYRTANLFRENVVTLPSGIYLARVECRKEVYDALVYIGSKPSFSRGKKELVVEVHVLDFCGDLYGEEVWVQFLGKVRDDRLFSDEKSLSDQIARDVERARSYFRSHHFSSAVLL
ncbi:MAG: bifunctional riboflavin kinase/FAD synthetase [Elusimicrobia bacterium]|nr:bifunctional riboflavin kinase/FAD synthetase [Elusimicrobiota bacterium]